MCTRSKPWFDTELLGCVAWKLEIPQAFQVLLILKLNNSDPEFVQKEIVENKTSNIKLNKLEIRYRMSIDSFSQNYTLCVSPSDSMYITYILYIYILCIRTCIQSVTSIILKVPRTQRWVVLSVAIRLGTTKSTRRSVKATVIWLTKTATLMEDEELANTIITPRLEVIKPRTFHH